MDELTARFKNFIAAKNLFQKDDTAIVAVSGGMDSVTLCELCARSSLRFEIAHCNFQLRGEDSDRDQRFVETLARKYNVPIHLQSFDTTGYATQMKLSTQEAARNLRYDWFHVLLEARKQQHINALLLTAHHANDAIETLLMNFFKGTGIHGLQGIPARNGKIVRPLLFATREEIQTFVNTEKLEFVEDVSNQSDKYTRNYFRNQLIPSIRKVFPAVEENLRNNLSRFQDAGIIYDLSVKRIREKLAEQRGNEVHLPVLKILKTPAYATVLYEILRDFDFLPTQLPDVINLLHSETGKYVDSSTYRCLRNRKWLIIAPKHTTPSQNILIDKEDSEVFFAGGILKVHKKDWHDGLNIHSDAHTAMVDAEHVFFPLLLRPWKQGDYFYPLGLEHKKKLSRFFIDQKLSITDKEKIWVLESRKKILWVIGLRIDHRFRIKDTTSKLIEIRLNRQ